MKNLMKKFLNNKSGATAIEYGLIAALIAAAEHVHVEEARAHNQHDGAEHEMHADYVERQTRRQRCGNEGHAKRDGNPVRNRHRRDVVPRGVDQQQRETQTQQRRDHLPPKQPDDQTTVFR